MWKELNGIDPSRLSLHIAKHQGHVAYDMKNNTPLSNLYLRTLHQLGIECESFGSSIGRISEV